MECNCTLHMLILATSVYKQRKHLETSWPAEGHQRNEKIAACHLNDKFDQPAVTFYYK